MAVVRCIPSSNLPISNFPACIEQVHEPTYPQALFPQPAVEALHMRVLRWLARLDVAQLDLPLQGPGQEVTTGQLRPLSQRVLGGGRTGPCSHQHPRHAPVGKACVHF